MLFMSRSQSQNLYNPTVSWLKRLLAEMKEWSSAGVSGEEKSRQVVKGNGCWVACRIAKDFYEEGLLLA